MATVAEIRTAFTKAAKNAKTRNILLHKVLRCAYRYIRESDKDLDCLQQQFQLLERRTEGFTSQQKIDGARLLLSGASPTKVLPHEVLVPESHPPAVVDVRVSSSSLDGAETDDEKEALVACIADSMAPPRQRLPSLSPTATDWPSSSPQHFKQLGANNFVKASPNAMNESSLLAVFKPLASDSDNTTDGTSEGETEEENCGMSHPSLVRGAKNEQLGRKTSRAGIASQLLPDKAQPFVGNSCRDSPSFAPDNGNATEVTRQQKVSQQKTDSQSCSDDEVDCGTISHGLFDTEACAAASALTSGTICDVAAKSQAWFDGNTHGLLPPHAFLARHQSKLRKSIGLFDSPAADSGTSPELPSRSSAASMVPVAANDDLNHCYLVMPQKNSDSPETVISLSVTSRHCLQLRCADRGAQPQSPPSAMCGSPTCSVNSDNAKIVLGNQYPGHVTLDSADEDFKVAITSSEWLSRRKQKRAGKQSKLDGFFGQNIMTSHQVTPSKTSSLTTVCRKKVQSTIDSGLKCKETTLPLQSVGTIKKHCDRASLSVLQGCNNSDVRSRPSEGLFDLDETTLLSPAAPAPVGSLAAVSLPVNIAVTYAAARKDKGLFDNEDLGDNKKDLPKNMDDYFVGIDGGGDMVSKASARTRHGLRSNLYRSPLKDANFDLPSRKSIQPTYAYAEVVRGKKRLKLKGHSCRQCVEYFSAMNLSEEEQRRRLNAVCRHRARKEPPQTPAGFWDLQLDSTEQLQQ